MQLIETLLSVLDGLRLRKSRAILYFLIADAPRVHRSEKVIDLFWQSSDESRASTSFRQAIKHIRRALSEVEGVSLDTNLGEVSLRLPHGFDLHQAISRLLSGPDWNPDAAGRVRQMIDQSLQLEGISASFDSWLAITRVRLLAVVRQTLDPMLQAGNLAADHGRARAEFALALEPSNEMVARLLMQLDWQGGRPTRAIERYNALYAHLDEAFDQEPEPETVTLLAAIKLDPNGGARLPLSAEPAAQVCMAVTLLPGHIPDAALDSLLNVLFADLRMRMSRFREWRIVGTGSDEKPQVQILLRPYQMNGALRLFVEVLSGPGAYMVWSEWIEQPQTDWEHKVRQLLSHIANTLSVAVSDRALADSGLDIYDQWLKAQALLDSWSPQSEAEALTILRDITARAPRFGPAHAELAGALNVHHVLLPGTYQTEDLRRDAMHHAIVAVSADPLDTRAHRVLAWCFCHMSYFELSEFHFDQALSLNRSNPLTLASCALGFAFSGDLAKSAALVAEAKSHQGVMEPFHKIYLAAADYLAGDFAAAATLCEGGAGLMPTVGGWHAAALWQLGHHGAAVARLNAYLAELRSDWHGAPLPDDGQLLDWFLSVFPLRHDTARKDLHLILHQIHAAARPTPDAAPDAGSG